MKLKAQFKRGISRALNGYGSDGSWGARGWGSDGSREFPMPATKLGLFAFLAAATVLFAMLTSAYLMQQAMSDWRPLPLPALLWLNTGLLLLSSAALEWARRSARRHLPRTSLWLLAAGVLAILFITGQLWAWQKLSAAGYFLATNPSSSFFYLLTAIHGLHVLGGLVAWGRTMTQMRQKTFAPQTQLSVELCALYWHFLLLVWLVMLLLFWLT